MKRLAALLIALAACGGKSPTTSTQTPDTTTKITPKLAIVGGDVSALARLEQAGAVYKNAGTTGDAISILKAKGANTFRLRVFVNPNYQDVQVNDLAYTVALAKRIKAAGALFVLDLHYSDTWADPGHQSVPAAWASLDMNGLEQKVEDYTADVVTQLRDNGAPPDIVQIGNEIDAGMLWPLGRVGGAYDNDGQWKQLARLLNAGIRGVHRVSASSKIMLHYSQGGSTSGTNWFFSHIKSYGVSYDYVGLSYYPFWHGTLQDLKSNLDATASAFGKDIIIAETAYPWRSGGWETQVTNSAAMTWTISQTGQSNFLRDLTATVASTSGSHGAGIIWWYPESVQVPGVFIWSGGSMALFDADGNALPAAALFLNYCPLRARAADAVPQASAAATVRRGEARSR